MTERKTGLMFVSGPGCNVSVPFTFGTEAADADGSVADHPEPVTAERRIVGAEPHRSDLDVMRHEA